MITLRFTYNPTWYNRIIRAYTWHPYTHVDVCMTDTSFIGALPNVGVVIHNQGARDVKYMTLDVDFNLVIGFMQNQVGKKYDWKGIFGLTFHENFEIKDRWFCSELVGAAINHASPGFFSVPAYKLTPRDIALVCREAR